MASNAFAGVRPVIRGPSDLPPRKFSLAEAPSRAFLGERFARETLPRLRAEAERTRASFDIADPAVAEDLRVGLAAIALLQHRPKDVEALVAEARRSAIKPQLKAIGLLRYEALAEAERRGCEAGAARLRRTLMQADAVAARDEALAQRIGVESAAPALYAGIVAAQMDGSANGRVTLLEGLTLAGFRASATLTPRCRVPFSAAIAAWAAKPANRPTDIWRSREPDAALLSHSAPVVVAVWDHGYDTALFPGQLAIDAADPLNGRDDDGDGVVDDWNGPTFGYRLEPLQAPYPPPSPALSGQLAFQMALRKGDRDLAAGDDTAESRLFSLRSREASLTEQTLDTQLWDEVGDRDHGTEVASEIADGAPYVRLFNVAALPFGYEPAPIPLDEAQIDRWLRTFDVVGQRMRGAGVRVVNISWGLAAEEITASLLSVGGETDPARAKARGAALHAKADKALRRVIAACPDILFVVGAGNSNQSEDVLANTPQTIRAPNLIVVGAASENGGPTSITTYGPGVRIYAQGQAVPVRTPGGMRMRASGTSMAAPLVARAAAGMLAANPHLTPAQLIAGLISSSTSGQSDMRLLHPANAIRWGANRRQDSNAGSR